MDLTRLRRELERHTDLDVACRFCRQPAGLVCRTVLGQKTAPHGTRRTDASHRKAEIARLIAWEEKIAREAAVVRAPEVEAPR